MSSGFKFMRLSRAASNLSRPKTHNIRSLQRTFATTPSRFAPGSVPRIASPSLWTAIVPKFIRERNSQGHQGENPKEWNPATYFIVMFIFVGSQAIRLLTLRNEYNDYVRSTDAKIRLLREVIDKLNRGEEVDVKHALGTGNPQAEAEWEQVIEEIENEEWQPKRAHHKSREQREAAKNLSHEQTGHEDTVQGAAKTTSVKQPSEGNFF